MTHQSPLIMIVACRQEVPHSSPTGNTTQLTNKITTIIISSHCTTMINTNSLRILSFILMIRRMKLILMTSMKVKNFQVETN